MFSSLVRFFGKSKPESASDYFSDFIADFNDAFDNGIQINGKKVDVELEKLVLDAPAKSFALSIASHNAYCSRTKCEVVGEWKNRSVFCRL